MALRPEGGAFKCAIHEFETDDGVEWEKHKLKLPHYISGSAACIDCGNPVQFENILYRGAGRPLFVVCAKDRAKRARQRKQMEAQNDKQ
jgi:hypothetical protein